MVQLIADDGIFFAEQRLKQSAVGIETGAVQNGVLGAEKSGNRRFKIAMAGLRAANKAHRCHAKSVVVEAALGGSDQAFVVCEAEIIVGAKVDDLGTGFQPQRCLLWRRDQSFAFEETVIAYLFECGVQMPIKGIVHSCS